MVGQIIILISPPSAPPLLETTRNKYKNRGSYFLPFCLSSSTLNFINLVISYLQGWKKSTTSKSLSFLRASNVLSVRAGTSSLNVEVTLALSTVADTSSSSVSSAEKEKTTKMRRKKTRNKKKKRRY